MSTVSRNRLPLYFETPNHAQLREKVQSLSPMEQEALEVALQTVAQEEGVRIERWDTQWSKNHLFDSDGRLVRAFLKRLKDAIQMHARCPANIADLVVGHSPFLNNIHWDSTTFDELVERAQHLFQLNYLKNQLGGKYPELNLFCEDSTSRIRGWKAQETFLLTLPTYLSPKEKERFKYFTSIVRELIQGKYDAKSAELILDTLLERESRRPSAPHLEDQIRLLDVKRIAESQIRGCGLNRADESIYKDIFIVPHKNEKRAKFKPLPSCETAKETHAYRCDRMLGIGMTAPTILLKTKSLAASLDTIRQLFHSAMITANKTVSISENETGKDVVGAKWLREKAFSLLNSHAIPQEVRNSIFGEMFLLCGDSRQVEQLGEFLFFDKPGFGATDKQRECALSRYLASDAFISHQSKFRGLGSIQLWKNDCGRAYDYIVNDERGGAKLKTAPKSLVHLYALLGILKGSKDCSSGNTLIQFDSSKGEISYFWDMDDESSMPMSNDFWHIRLWQMGLPQCAQPFDRAFLLLFTDPALLGKLKQIQSSANIHDTAYKAQIERLSKIMTIFKEELDQNRITLTPRELFFKLFGGREDFNAIKRRCNEDKSEHRDGVRISPIELFEFCLAEMGRGAHYSDEWQVKQAVKKNMYALYAPELP